MPKITSSIPAGVDFIQVDTKKYPWYADPEASMRDDISPRNPLRLAEPHYIVVGVDAVDEFRKMAKVIPQAQRKLRDQLRQFKLTSAWLKIKGLVKLCDGSPKAMLFIDQANIDTYPKAYSVAKYLEYFLPNVFGKYRGSYKGVDILGSDNRPLLERISKKDLLQYLKNGLGLTKGQRRKYLKMAYQQRRKMGRLNNQNKKLTIKI